MRFRRRSVWLPALTLVATSCVTGAVLSLSDGARAVIKTSHPGAWVASADAASVSHLGPDGVDATVALPNATGELHLVQVEGVAYVSDASGRLSRIDPAQLEVSQEAMLPTADSKLVAGGGRLYAVDAAGTVRELDPVQLTSVGQPVNVGNHLGAAVVDGSGVLWVVNTDTGQVVPVDNRTVGQGHQVADRGVDVRLSVVGHDVVAVNPATSTATVVSGTATATPHAVPSDAGATLDAPDVVDEGSLLPIITGRHTLTLLHVRTGQTRAVELPVDGHELGTPRLAKDKVYIADFTAGTVLVVDVASAAVINTITVTGRPGRFEIVVDGSTVYVNDPHSEHAWTINAAGELVPAEKYDPNNPNGSGGGRQIVPPAPPPPPTPPTTENDASNAPTPPPPPPPPPIATTTPTTTAPAGNGDGNDAGADNHPTTTVTTVAPRRDDDRPTTTESRRDGDRTTTTAGANHGQDGNGNGQGGQGSTTTATREPRGSTPTVPTPGTTTTTPPDRPPTTTPGTTTPGTTTTTPATTTTVAPGRNRPGAATITSITPGDGVVEVVWDWPGPGRVDGYRVDVIDANSVTIATRTVAATPLTTTIAGLPNGSELRAVVYGYLNDASGPVVGAPATSNPFVTRGKPFAPGSVIAAVTGNGRARVSWTAPNANGSAITGYSIVANGAGRAIAAPDVVPDQTQTDVGGLNVGTTYTFTVTATNAYGASSATSAPIMIDWTDPPDAPGSVAGTAGYRAVTVSWTAANGNGTTIASYIVRNLCDGTTRTVPGAETSYPWGGLAAGASCRFDVRAIGANGKEGLSAATSGAITALGAPQPTNVVADPLSPTVVQVRFDQPAPIGPAIARWLLTTTPDTGLHAFNYQATPSFDMTGLSAATTYTFSVVAVDAADVQSAPVGVQATTQSGLPTAVTGLVANVNLASRTTGRLRVTFSWTPVIGATSYRVDRGNGAATYLVTTTTDVWTTIGDDGTYTATVTALNVYGEAPGTAVTYDLPFYDPVINRCPTKPIGCPQP